MPRHGVVFEGREQKLQEVAGQIPFADKKAVRVGKRCDWYFSKRMRIQAVSHPAEPVEGCTPCMRAVRMNGLVAR